MINSDTVYAALDGAIYAFRDILDADFDRQNIVIRLFDESNKGGDFRSVL